MTDDLTDLDTRARRAATDLHEVASRRPVPNFEPDHLTAPVPAARSGRSRRPLAIAAAVVLVAGAATGVVVANRDDGGKTITATTLSPARPFEAGWLPDGLTPGGVGTSSVGDDRVFISDVQVLGADGDPLVAFGFGPAVAELTASGELADVESVEVEGHTVWHVPHPYGVEHETWSVVEAGDRSIVVIAPSVPVDERDRLAIDAGVDDGTIVLPDAAQRWDRLVVLDDLTEALPLGEMMPTAGTTSHHASYNDLTTVPTDRFYEGPDLRGATVSSTELDFDPTPGTLLLLPDARRVEVRGQDGVVARLPDHTQDLDRILVVWQERPGEVLSVSGIGLTEDEVLHIAEDVRPADPAAWTSRERDTQLGRYSDEINYPGFRTVELGVGELDDGSRWRVVHRTPPEDAEGERWNQYAELDLRLVVPGERSTSSTSEDFGPPFGEAFRVVSGEVAMAAGLVDDTVAAVRIESTDGDVLAEPDLLVADGFRAWVTEIPASGAVVVALDADGSEIGRRPVIRPDSSCGPDGIGGDESGEGTYDCFTAEGTAIGGAETATTITGDGMPAPEPVLPGD